MSLSRRQKAAYGVGLVLVVNLAAAAFAVATAVLEVWAS